MKLSVLVALCLSLLIVHMHVSVARKSKLFKNPFKKTKDSIQIKTKQPNQNTGSYPRQPGGTYHNQGGYPQQPAGGYPQYPGQPGGYPNPGSYPQHPARGYPQYPNQPGGYPYPGSYPQHPARGYPQYPNQPGGYPYHRYTYGGGNTVYGNYPGSYINHNPNNKILSPHYGGSFGYGGYGGGGGSLFAHSVQNMGYAPSDKSRGFGRSAVMAAAGGAMAGMALGYGLGRFPRPHFHFHSPQEEYYYNYYMYRRYGLKSTDRNDYSRDYQLSKPPESFDSFMDSCMKRTDLLPGESRRTETKATKVTSSTKTTTASTTTSITTTTGNIISNTTAAGNVSYPSNLTNSTFKKSEVSATTQRALQILHNNEGNDDTVSIVEIGYPALIKQMKVKRCTELYIVYSEKHLKKKVPPSQDSGVQRLDTGWQALLSVLVTTIMMLMTCKM